MKPDKRDEAALILIREAAGLAGFLVTLYVMKFVMRPDSIRGLRMKGALLTKRVAQAQADAWQNVANRAATTYHKVSM